MTSPTVLIVPGLRDHDHEHWQTWLATRLELVRTVPPMGRTDLDLAARVRAVERAGRAISWPIIVVAHSAGAITVAHWAETTRCHVIGALLAVPPDLERPMPHGYPDIVGLRRGGWLPVPQDPLPFPSIVAASRNDPLATFQRVTRLATAWGSRLVDLGDVGHLNPASGHGAWPRALELIDELAAGHRARSQTPPSHLTRWPPLETASTADTMKKS
jgi:predicted alpha/beta hydrolase family esterase